MSKKIAYTKCHILDLPYDCLLYTTEFFREPSEANAFLRTCKIFFRLLNDVSVSCGCEFVQFRFISRRSDTVDAESFRMFFPGPPHSSMSQSSHSTKVPNRGRDKSSGAMEVVSGFTASFYPFVKRVVLGELFLDNVRLGIRFLMRFPFLKSLSLLGSKIMEPRIHLTSVIHPRMPVFVNVSGPSGAVPMPFFIHQHGQPVNRGGIALRPSLNDEGSKPSEGGHHFPDFESFDLHKGEINIGDFLFGFILPKFKLLESVSFVAGDKYVPMKKGYALRYFRTWENVRSLSLSLRQCLVMDSNALLQMNSLKEVHIHGLFGTMFSKEHEDLRKCIETIRDVKVKKFLSTLNRLYLHIDSEADVRKKLDYNMQHKERNLIGQLRFLSDVNPKRLSPSIYPELWNMFYSAFESLSPNCEVRTNVCACDKMKLISEHFTTTTDDDDDSSPTSIASSAGGKRSKVKVKCIDCASCTYCRSLPSPITAADSCGSCMENVCDKCMRRCKTCEFSTCPRCFEDTTNACLGEEASESKLRRVITVLLLHQKQDENKRRGELECECEVLQSSVHEHCTLCREKFECSLKSCGAVKCRKCSRECSHCSASICLEHYDDQNKNTQKLLCLVCFKTGCLKCSRPCSQCSKQCFRGCEKRKMVGCEQMIRGQTDKVYRPFLRLVGLNQIEQDNNEEEVDDSEPFVEEKRCISWTIISEFDSYCHECFGKVGKVELAKLASSRQPSPVDLGYCRLCDKIFCRSCSDQCGLCNNVCGKALPEANDAPKYRSRCFSPAPCFHCRRVLCIKCVSPHTPSFCFHCEKHVESKPICRECYTDEWSQHERSLKECSVCRRMSCPKCSKQCKDCNKRFCFKSEPYYLPSRIGIGTGGTGFIGDPLCIMRCWGCSNAVCRDCFVPHHNPIFGVLCSQCSSNCKKDEWKHLFRKYDPK